jgi:F0F1-type ATP synthase membrane subunit b/b'
MLEHEHVSEEATMAVLFLLLAVLIGVVLVDAVLENTTATSTILFNRSFDQLSGGELLAVFAGLGFLLALFLFLAFGASRGRRSRRKELRSRRRDAEGRVGELERENADLRQELTRSREETEALERDRTSATTERDRAEATADRLRAHAAAEPDRAGATAIDNRQPAAGNRPVSGDDPVTTVPPEPDSVRHERRDDRPESVTPVREEHVRAADEHARAASDEAPRRR